LSAGVSATLGRIALLAAPVLGACERPAVGPRGAEPPAVAPSPPATRPASPPSVLVDAATARLLERVRSLPVRGGLAYWGLVPPAECSPVGASEVALRFGCTTGLDALEAYFEYYFPMVPVRRSAGRRERPPLTPSPPVPARMPCGFWSTHRRAARGIRGRRASVTGSAPPRE
jgi:hypothetical protein